MGMRSLISILVPGLLVAVSAVAAPPGPAGGTVKDNQRLVSGALQSPVQTFRDLLAKSAAEREEVLVTKPAHYRKYLADKLAEYEALAPDQRELRLRMLQLKWHLLPLLHLPSVERAAQLARLTEDDRKLVTERLDEWDKLPPAAQKDLLDNQYTIDYFARLAASPPGQRLALLDRLSPEHRARLEGDFARLNALPADQRDRIYRNFTQFFELNEREQEKILAALPQSARGEMQKTVGALEKLPADQRQRCLEALQKFTAMNPAERDQFLRNAERWQGMSADQRESWRDLVRKLPPEPPLPPGFLPPTASAPAAPSSPH